MGKRVLFISFTCTKQVNKLITRLILKYTCVCVLVRTDWKLTNAAERVETKQLHLRVCAPQDLSRAHRAVTYAYTRRSCQGSHVWRSVSIPAENQTLIYWTELTSASKQNFPSSAIWGIIQILLHRLVEETLTKQLVPFSTSLNQRTKHWENTGGERKRQRREWENWCRVQFTSELKSVWKWDMINLESSTVCNKHEKKQPSFVQMNGNWLNPEGIFCADLERKNLQNEFQNSC